MTKPKVECDTGTCLILTKHTRLIVVLHFSKLFNYLCPITQPTRANTYKRFIAYENTTEYQFDEMIPVKNELTMLTAHVVDINPCPFTISTHSCCTRLYIILGLCILKRIAELFKTILMHISMKPQHYGMKCY